MHVQSANRNNIHYIIRKCTQVVTNTRGSTNEEKKTHIEAVIKKKRSEEEQRMLESQHDFSSEER